MNRRRLVRTLVLALLVLSAPALRARAAEPAANANTMRDRISADIAAGLAHTAIVPAPQPLASKPASLHSKRAAATPSGAPEHTAPVTAAPSDSTPDGVWASLLAGNQRFVSGHPRAYPLARERDELVRDQHPRAIVLGCSDSRVGPELVFDQTLGDVFVVRTAGNIVDPIALGSIEYAVDHLHAKLLIVLGHSSCGAVRAAAAGGEMPSAYLQAIVDRIQPTVQRLSNCFEGDELIERSVIANAKQSAADVLANSKLLREAVAKGDLRVMSAVYDLSSGVVTPLSAPAATATAAVPGH